MKSKILFWYFLALSLVSAQAQGTAFTYQGKLSSASGSATGSYDLTFALFTTNSGPGQVGSTITNTATAVSNGLFSVIVDFGVNFPGADRWLEIGLRTNGNGAFTTLAPRQKITPAPYAVTAVNLAGVVGNNTVGTNYFPTVAGGSSNVCTGIYSTIGGGYSNVNVTAAFATIAGGQYNNMAGNYGTIGGGQQNLVNGFLGTVGGGSLNTAGANAAIAGGYQNTSSGNYSVVAGGRQNASSALYSGTLGGYQNTSSGTASTLSGGELNSSSGDHATLGGGEQNQCTGDRATLGGGRVNICSNQYAALVGGYANVSGGQSAFLGGGEGNQSIGLMSAVPGGSDNIALGAYSFAAGRYAHANHDGAFVWADGVGVDYASTGNNQFLIRAGGGVGIGVTAPQQSLSVAAGLNIDQNNGNVGSPINCLTFGSSSGEGIGSKRTPGANQYGLDFYTASFNRMSILNVNGNVGIGTNVPQEKLHVVGRYIRVDGAGNEQVYMGGDGAGNDAQFGSLNSAITDVAMWNPTRNECMNVNAKAFIVCSDRNMKDIAGEVHAEDVLNKVVAMPVQRWNFKGETDIQHIGPMAQDFRAAFGLGKDDKHIATVDADGIALAAIQGLNEKVEKKHQHSEDRLQKLEAENAELKTRLAKLEEMLETGVKP